MRKEQKCTKKNNIGTDVIYYIYCSGLWQSLVSRQSFTVAILKTPGRKYLYVIHIA